MTELIVGHLGSVHGVAEKVDVDLNLPWDTYEQLEVSTSLPITTGDNIDVDLNFDYEHGSFKSIFNNLSLPWDEYEQLNTPIEGKKAGIAESPMNNLSLPWDEYEQLNTPIEGKKDGTTPRRNFTEGLHRLVNITFDKVNPDSEWRYLPTSDFVIDSELVSFTTDFVEPLDYDLVKTVLSPVGSNSSYPWNRTRIVDIYKNLTYGYGLNNFLVGGGVGVDYTVDDDAINPPIDPPPQAGVIKVVNVINVVKLPERTPINFTDFTLALDLDSVSWVVNFTISSQASLDILKPVGLTTVDVEININGEIFIVFIGRTSTSLNAKQGGGISRAFKCTGWSRTKLLSYPYHARRSHVETSSSTPAGLVNDELTGTGFTATWNSPSWTIPANIFSYFEKAPLAAIAELAEAVGAVIVPTSDADSFTIEPRYETSPWDWDIASVDRTLNESEFFTMDTNWVPQQAPDSIYVYGEEGGGVAVKCVKSGTAGLVTLPTIVNKYITDTIAGTERGRIEVSRAHFQEIIPVTTYVDAVEGIIKPRELLQVNALAGGNWRGMVTQTTVSCKRNGSAVIQSLNIEVHYE